MNTPQDAYRCFMATEMDALVLQGHLLYKKQMKRDSMESEKYIAQFHLD